MELNIKTLRIQQNSDEQLLRWNIFGKCNIITKCDIVDRWLKESRLVSELKRYDHRDIVLTCVSELLIVPFSNSAGLLLEWNFLLSQLPNSTTRNEQLSSHKVQLSTRILLDGAPMWQIRIVYAE